MAEFDESKHPRKKDGKFAPKGKSEQRLKELEHKYNDNLLLNNTTHFKPAVGFANKERLNTKDHIKHAKEMGYKNQKEYEKGACEFFNSNQGKLFWGKRRNRYFRYDKKSGKLCVSSNGIIYTFLNYNLKKFNKIKEQEQLYEL